MTPRNPLRGLAAAALLALAALPGKAGPFTLFVYESPADIALRTDTGAAGAGYWAAYAAFAAEAGKAGILRGGAPLMTGTDRIRAVRLRDGEREVTEAGPGPGPFRLGGYFQIDVPDLAAALDWAAKLPAARTAFVEVVEGYPAPAM